MRIRRYKRKAGEAGKALINISALLILLAGLALGIYILTVDLRTGAVIVGAVVVVLASILLSARDAVTTHVSYLEERAQHQETKRMKSAEPDDVYSL